MNKNQSFVGLDIGGTWTKGAVLSSDKKILAKAVAPTPKTNPGDLLRSISGMIEDFSGKAPGLKLSGIGLGLPGLVDRKSGRLVWAANSPHLKDMDLADKLRRKYKVPVKAMNDADCFVLAEALMGAGQGKPSVFGLALGTGIGGAWYVDGAVRSGLLGGGGEPGHMVIDLRGKHTLNSYYRKLFKDRPGVLARQAKAGHPGSLKSCRDFGAALGAVIANISNVIAPDAFVIGGGMYRHARLFLPAARESARRHMVPGPARGRTRIAVSRLGDHAGAIGAAFLASAEL